MQKLVKSLSYILSLSLIVFLLPFNSVNAAPTYIYEWASQSGDISSDGLAHEYTNLEAGQTISLSLTLINRSGITIVGKSNLSSSPDKQVPVGVWGIGSQTPYQDGTPSFLDLSSFVLNNNRFIYYDGPNVPDNGILTMSWTIKLASNLSDGVYNLYVRPVSEYLAWTRQIKNGRLLPTTSSDIFWRLTVGEGVMEYIATNSSIGFQVLLPSNYAVHGIGMFDDPQGLQVQITAEGMSDIGYIYIENENSIVLNMTLQEWALNVYEKNEEVPNRVRSELISGNYLNDRFGYGFTVTEGFRSYSGGTALFKGKTYQVYLIENQHGDKVYLYYAIGDVIAEQIVATLKFV